MSCARGILAELHRLADAVERIAAVGERAALALEELAARERPGADARLVRLVRAIFASLGDQEFVCSDVLALAAGPAPRPALRDALAGASAKGLGKLLAEHQAEPLDGLRIERVGRRRWRVCAIETARTRAAWNPWRT